MILQNALVASEGTVSPSPHELRPRSLPIPAPPAPPRQTPAATVFGTGASSLDSRRITDRPATVRRTLTAWSLSGGSRFGVEGQREGP